MKKDHSGIKFEVSEELGEWMNCLYLKRNDDQAWSYDFIHHANNDGVGAITKILEKEGHQVTEQPQIRARPPLSLFSKLKLLKEFIDLTKSVDLKWKKKRRDTRGIPETFCLCLLTPKQTQDLHHRAEQEKVSLNSWLLFNLDAACNDLILSSNSERKWISPINMRADKEKVYSNQSASIIVNFLKKNSIANSPRNLHTEIKSYLSRNLHWGSYLYSNMAMFIGKRGTLKVADRIKEVGTGVFSNLGSWPSQGIQINKSASKLYNRRAVIAPATQILPIATTAWQWGERLSLSLQLHPSLNLEAQYSLELLRKWTELIGLDADLAFEQHNWRDYPECPPKKIVKTPFKTN